MTPATRTPPSTGRVRLHITPFNPHLYEKVVPSTAKAEASNISFHAVQTFPERGFGFIELSTMEADKLKKKLNGSTLKGTKVKVDEAKKERKRKGGREDGDAEAEDEEERRARKKAKKEKKKREEGVIAGHELEQGRNVKRGWSEEKGKKDKKMLFKTAIPAHALPVEEKSKAKGKDKKETKEKTKSKSGKKERTVREFSESRKPVVDTTVEGKPIMAYEEGKGWVDGNGEVVEAEPPSKKRKRQSDEVRKARETAEKLEAEAAMLREKAAQEASKPVPPGAASESEASSSTDVSEADSSSDEENDSDKSAVQQESADKVPNATSATAKSSTPPPAEIPREVHPLEALYKRPVSSPSDERKPKLNPIKTSFSFFKPDGDDEDEEVAQPALPPQTPHTKQDMEWRSLRSAAPTPDTAALGKRFKFPFENVGNDDDEDVDEEMMDAEAATGGAAVDGDAVNGEEREESDFRKWFYEKRGDNNRAWKKMRRDAKKQQRQRENRRLSRRVA